MRARFGTMMNRIIVAAGLLLNQVFAGKEDRFRNRDCKVREGMDVVWPPWLMRGGLRQEVGDEGASVIHQPLRCKT